MNGSLGRLNMEPSQMGGLFSYPAKRDRVVKKMAISCYA